MRLYIDLKRKSMTLTVTSYSTSGVKIATLIGPVHVCDELRSQWMWSMEVWVARQTYIANASETFLIQLGTKLGCGSWATKGLKSRQSFKELTKSGHTVCVQSSRFFLRWANLGLSLCITFVSNSIIHKNCWVQQDWNFEYGSMRQTRWPLDHHHHGPKFKILLA